jgi:hypothetical protein
MNTRFLGTQKTLCRTRWRGAFLVELMVYFMVMIIVGDLVLQISNLSFHAMKQSRQRDTLITRVDTAIDLLRRDMWNARAVSVVGGRAEIHQPGREIVWEMEATGGLTRRIEGETPRTWIDMPPMTFKAAPFGMRVEVESGPKGPEKTEGVSLVSALITSGGAR